MEYLVLFVFFFTGYQCFNVLMNLLFRQKLRPLHTEPDVMVSVLIPVRNEEHNIGRLLASLREIHSPRLEIIVCNDHSTDQTEAVVKHYAQEDNRIRLIQSKPLPTGWLGKNHACYQLAQHAAGEYLLFLDADVELSGNPIPDAVEHCKRYGLALLTIFPMQKMVTRGEKNSVPLMNYILLTLLPLIFVRISPFKSHAAANGQFMLFDASVYRKQQPHQRFKNSAVEDIAIARYFKRLKIKIACLTGDERVVCRMYHSYNEAVSGFSKNVFMFFGNIPWLAFLFWLTVSFGFMPVLLCSFWWFLIYLSMIFFVLILYAIAAKQNLWESVLLFPVHMIFMFRVMKQAWWNRKNKNYTWKGRNIY